VGDVELEAAAALYTGAALEPLGPFAIVERILELWLARGLPVGATGSSGALDRYWRQRADGLAETERRAAYAGVFDTRFDALWAALLEALAEDDPEVERHADMVRAQLGARIDERTIALAPLLVEGLRAALDVLSDREVLDAHGARDMWQLIEQRARLDLGLEAPVVRVRTMAAAGPAIIGWLAAPDEDGAREEAADAARSWLAVALG